MTNPAKVIDLHAATRKALERIAHVTEAQANEVQAKAKTKGIGERGLTPKQENFARLVAQGNTLSESYRQSYNCSKSKPNTVWRRASDLINDSRVAARIDDLLRAREHDTLHDAKRLRQFVLERLQIEAINAKTDGARVRAVELIGKVDMVSMFKDIQETSANTKTPEELRAEILKRLTRALGPVDKPDESDNS